MDDETRREQRFVISAEQMLPFLERIHDRSDDSDSHSDDISSEMEESTFPPPKYENFARITIPPAISALATTASIALPNIYEEYVNFIDLSVLNPIIEAADCQRDQLIESEIRELRFDNNLNLFFFFDRNEVISYDLIALSLIGKCTKS